MDFESVRDGERLSVGVKDAGAAEIFPQTLKHNSNGRFVVACGDGEYIIYTAMALRNKVISYFVSVLCLPSFLGFWLCSRICMESQCFRIRHP